MTQIDDERFKREAWFQFFTQLLYYCGAITEDKKEELESKISEDGKNYSTA